MNQKQKYVLGTVFAILAMMLVYPPFSIIGYSGIVLNSGYAYIFDPPKHGYITATVNIQMLLSQWIGVIIGGGIAWLLAAKK